MNRPAVHSMDAICDHCGQIHEAESAVSLAHAKQLLNEKLDRCPFILPYIPPRPNLFQRIINLFSRSYN